MTSQVRIIMLVAVGILAIALAVWGFGNRPERNERYGATLSVAEATALSDVLARPADFEGRTVRIEGSISRECPTGCWFDVDDGAVTLYVDLEPAGLAIPQRVGKTVSVEGTVAVDNGQAKLLGRAVEIR